MRRNAADKVMHSLYVNQAKRLVNYLVRRVYDEEDAKELAQEAFARVMHIERQRPIDEPQHYLLRVAANLAIEHRNRQKRSVVDVVEELPEQEDELQSVSLDDQIAGQQALARVGELLQELPPNVQAALILHRRDGYTYDEIALKLGVSKSMVKKYLRKGVSYIQEAMSTLAVQEVVNDE